MKMLQEMTAAVGRMWEEVRPHFTDHPEQTGETYWQHLWFTLCLGCRFLYVSAVIILHGVFPFLCVRTASNQIETVYRVMKMRIPKARLQQMEEQEQHYHGA